MDLLIIGAGLSGATIAHKAAQDGKKVLLLEKRNFVGGNVYDFKINDILVHKYGPHIFHTNNEEVNNFMKQFWTLNGFKNKVKGYVDNKLVSIPFNFKGIETFWPKKAQSIKEKFLQKYKLNSRVSILEIINDEDKVLKEVANFVYKNIFENYTTKMWGVSPKEIDKSVIARVPIVMGYADRYFSDKFEGVPIDGYTNTIKNMLNNKNIKIELSKNALDSLKLKNNKIYFNNKEVTCPIIYTGQIDELFNFEFGNLEYRSLDIKFESKNVEYFQETAVVNFPSHKIMTRITEYKHMTLQKSDKTVISMEYPGWYKKDAPRFNEPYYPMATDRARNSYNKYIELASKIKNLHLVGRLATFKYLNMDQAISLALKKYEEIK